MTLKEQIQQKGIILPFTGSNITFGKQPECTLDGETFPVEVKQAERDERGKITKARDANITIETKLTKEIKR
jgi:hypothetical protein